MRKQIENLFNLIEQNRLTGYEIAKKTGISENQVYKIKRGDISLDNISLKNAEKLAALYEEEVLDILVDDVRTALENQKESYYIEYYGDIDELLEEQELTKAGYLERVNERDHKIIEGVPVISYDNPLSDLYRVVYVTDGMSADDAIHLLEG